MRLQSSTAYQAAVGLVLVAGLTIIGLNVGAGMIGIEDDDPANLLYVGVLAIGAIGALIARFQPRGMARASFATAVAQAVVGAIALRRPNTASPTEIVILHSVLVALFAGAGVLFNHAARTDVPSHTECMRV
jgi:hypothetical protein